MPCTPSFPPCVTARAQAMATQDANRAAQNRMPPLWAIAAMVVLGFNEMMALLYNPLLLLLLLVLFLFGRTVYQVGRASGAAGVVGCCHCTWR